MSVFQYFDHFIVLIESVLKDFVEAMFNHTAQPVQIPVLTFVPVNYHHHVLQHLTLVK